jgi:hypothetical protein
MPPPHTSVQEWADARAAMIAAALPGLDEPTRPARFVGLDGAQGQVSVRRSLATLVDVRLTLPALGIDSVMQHVFAPSGSASPHLLSDLAVLADGTWHFHVDLVPRLDAVHEPEHLDAFAPLTPSALHAYALPGATPIDIPRRLRALSSPWLIGVVVDAMHADDLAAIHGAYVSRFIDLLKAPPPTAVDQAALSSRDRRHRAALFDDATDPVWSFLAEQVGPEPVETILGLVRGVQD